MLILGKSIHQLWLFDGILIASSLRRPIGKRRNSSSTPCVHRRRRLRSSCWLKQRRNQQFCSTDDRWNHQFVKQVFPLSNHPQFPSKLEDGWKVDYVDVQIQLKFHHIPSGKQPHSYGKSLFLMGKSTISMAIFSSYVKLPEGISHEIPLNHIKSH